MKILVFRLCLSVNISEYKEVHSTICKYLLCVCLQEHFISEITITQIILKLIHQKS